MPVARGIAVLKDKKLFKCPCCGQSFEKEVEIEGDVEIEFEMSDYAPDYP